MSLITIIGRGHGGTRAMSHTLQASGVYMGHPLNVSGDLLPPKAMYDACRVMARYVQWQGGLQWEFSALHTMPIPQEFTDLIHTYLVKQHGEKAMRDAERQRDRLLDQLARQAEALASERQNGKRLH